MEKHQWIAFSTFLLLLFVQTAVASDIEVETYSSGPTWITLKVQVTESRGHGSEITQYKVIYGQGSDKHSRNIRRSIGEHGTMVTISDLEEGEIYEISIRPVYSNRNVGAATIVLASTTGDMGINAKRGGGMGGPVASSATKPASTFVILSTFIAVIFSLMTATA